MIEGTNNNLKKAKIGNRDFFAFFSSSRQRDKNIEISMFFEEVYMRLSVSAVLKCFIAEKEWSLGLNFTCRSDLINMVCKTAITKEECFWRVREHSGRRA